MLQVVCTSGRASFIECLAFDLLAGAMADRIIYYYIDKYISTLNRVVKYQQAILAEFSAIQAQAQAHEDRPVIPPRLILPC